MRYAFLMRTSKLYKRNERLNYHRSEDTQPDFLQNVPFTFNDSN